MDLVSLWGQHITLAFKMTRMPWMQWPTLEIFQKPKFVLFSAAYETQCELNCLRYVHAQSLFMKNKVTLFILVCFLLMVARLSRLRWSRNRGKRGEVTEGQQLIRWPVDVPWARYQKLPNQSHLGYFPANTKIPVSNLEVLGLGPSRNSMCLLKNVVTSRVHSVVF